MRGSRAKALRRAARKLTAGAPPRAYLQNGYVRNGIPMRLSPDCTRAVYQSLKRGGSVRLRLSVLSS